MSVPCSSVNTPAGFVGPIDCDPTQGPVNYTPYDSVTQSLIDEVAGLARSPESIGPVAGEGFTAWLNANSKIIMIGAGVFVGVLLLTKGGRGR